MTRLGYEASGDVERPAILFLHGFMGSSGDWKAVAAALEEQFYCVAVDLPGHGASVGLPPESYTVEGATRSLVDLLDELAIERAVAVGYSMGGRLALFLALRYPERCAGLFLESASPGLESTAERTARRKSDEEKARRLESENFERFLRDWYRQPLFASLARHEELLQQTIEARRRNEPRELARSLRGMGIGSQPSLWGELAGLRLPTLAVAGALDGKYVGVSRCMATLSPKLRATVVPGAGHNVRVELTKEYITLLRGFLDTDDLS
ncbi:MAG TPA: 2-succinyl-6-hydroxy-2,4-cyclohexadiene-1-carboxylate synthase [Rubrobacteraceae bacterium]|nr:2-succinyl-6-hydroxy-2,4-cyclohexadiene-1-carboxylate synthase [Rubrobacteraceae bacterium]